MNSFLPININSLVPLISTSLFSMIRISSFFLATGILNRLSIPRNIQLFFYAFVSIAIMPHLLNSNNDLVNINNPSSVFNVIYEIVVGLSMGLLLQFTFEILMLVGQFIATSMQLSFALTIDPSAQSQTNVVSNFFYIFGILIFFSSNGLLSLVNLLNESFKVLPLNYTSLSIEQIKMVPLALGGMFSSSLLLALPVMATLFITNLSIAVMSRLTPALNIFSVGFLISILVGLITLIFSVPYTIGHLNGLIQNAFQLIQKWLHMGQT